MAFSKVTLNGETLMDVTDDTVAANNMLYGTRGTAANGTTVTGAVVTTPVDSTLDTTSHNAIENAAVASALALKADSSSIPSATSDLTNDSGFISTETDPTVPEWAKQSTKPTYTFSELTSHPTSISGYGITDAYTKTEVDGKVSGVLHYKGTKATVSALPSSGNTTGDVWHITADGSEWAWDGTEWQELGTAVDLSGYVPTSRTINSKALSANISLTASDVGALPSSTSVVNDLQYNRTQKSLRMSKNGSMSDVMTVAALKEDLALTASDVGALPSSTTYVSSFNGDTGAITYTAPVTSVNGQTGAVTVTEDDQTWNGVTLEKSGTIQGNSIYLAARATTSATTAYQIQATTTPSSQKIAMYNSNSYLNSTTPSANDNSTKVATTAYVDAAVSSLTPVVAYTATLTAANWSNTTPSTYTYSNTSLTCGASGDVPPLITCTSNETEYSTITSASATPGTGITFTAPSAPAGAIGLVIIDYK